MGVHRRSGIGTSRVDRHDHLRDDHDDRHDHDDRQHDHDGRVDGPRSAPERAQSRRSSSSAFPAERVRSVGRGVAVALLPNSYGLTTPV
jgi:hypothetical protein